MAAVYKPNGDGFKRMAAESPQIKEALRLVAEKAKVYAEGIATHFIVTGDYLASFKVDTEVIAWTGQYPGPRQTAVLQNTSGHAAAVEWGYKGRSGDESTSAHRVLGRTLDALGSD